MIEMNKTITVYELLGLVKDGKAPDKIKSEGHYYYFNVLEKDYYEGMGYDYEYLFKNISSDNLNDTIEIIEDNDKLENNFNFIYEIEDEKVNTNFKNIRTTLYEIIDHINKIEERLDER
jgi:hypothetical protein